MIDLAKQAELEKYLEERGCVSREKGYDIHYCKGGVSGTVVYVERADDKPLIVKQALAQLKTKEAWLCDPDRMRTEYDSNRIYHSLMPDNAPEVYFYDHDNYIYAREAVPDDCIMWKENLLTGLLDFRVAEKAIRTLVTVHNKCAGDEHMKARFADKTVFYNLRINPYIEFTVQKYPEFQEEAQRICKLHMDSSITLVHGDYSPKNIMVTDGRGISVLDYEVAYYGHPAFDLAFFANHFILKSIKFPDIADAYLAMLGYMLDIYFSEMQFMSPEQMEKDTIDTLKFLMLARVDGKSPVEYLTDEPEKQQIVRNIVKALIVGKMSDRRQLFDVIRANR